MEPLLLKTATEFLAYGLDRYAYTRRETQFEYKLAIVSFHLAVELLMKERLRRINELYIYEGLEKFDVILKLKHMTDPEVRGDVEVLNRLRKVQPRTITFPESVKRLSHFSKAAKQSAKALEHLAELRNALVHFGATSSAGLLLELDRDTVEEIKTRVYKRSKFMGAFVDSVAHWDYSDGILTLWFLPENRSLKEMLGRTQRQELQKIASETINKLSEIRFTIETEGTEVIDRLLGERIFPFVREIFDELGESAEKLLGKDRVSFLDEVMKAANKESELRVTKLLGKHKMLYRAMSEDDKRLRRRAFEEKWSELANEQEYVDKCPACGEDFSVFSEVDFDEDTELPSDIWYFGECQVCGLELRPTELRVVGMYPRRDEPF